MDTLDRKTLVRRGLLAGGGIAALGRSTRSARRSRVRNRATYLEPFRAAAVEASVAAA